MAGLTAPLTRRSMNTAISLVEKPLQCLHNFQGKVDTATFLKHVIALSKLLPTGRHAINLCENRYLFTIALAAIILKRQTNLLPPNKNITTQQELIKRYDDCYIIHDGIEVLNTTSVVDFNTITLDVDSIMIETIEIPLDHPAVISFTSGSTGQSKPNHKSWHSLIHGTDVNGHYMLGDQYTQGQMVATVPGQHMWGLETSIMLALRYDICVSDTWHLYSKDIEIVLSQLSVPKILVSTPIHLRAMAMSGIQFCQVDRILCATAPLDPKMATEIEQCFSADLMEIYGCSEIGSMAYRRTVNQEHWQLFDGISLTFKNDMSYASAVHTSELVPMQDIIELHGDGSFSLNGRQSDLIEIAGKRGSIKELNELLFTIEGLIDGVVFMLENKKTMVPRLAAMVVMKEGVPASRVTDKFKQYLDSAFIPRTILEVAALPREGNGKLPHKNIVDYFQTLTTRPKSFSDNPQATPARYR